MAAWPYIECNTIGCGSLAWLRLSQNLTNRLATVPDRHRPAGAVRDRHLRIDTQAAIARCTNVGRADRPILDESCLNPASVLI
jgi:hypothetical protein